ncbi:MAG TPA: DUF1501 domain-containing protein [Polyangiaceae bacterium]|nr:DUF1501 domain-containing protein [Polyangiaceae bacterium]
MTTRRKLLKGAILGAGLVGLRSLATGLPKSWLLGGREAHAEGLAPQYLILATSGGGDPFNANAPGSFVKGAQNNPLPDLAPAPVTFGGSSYQAAKCWGNLPAELRQRMAFFHHRTYTNAHPEHRKVMTLQGAAKSASGNGQEMLPSLIASELASTLGTIQTEPIPLGNELITYNARALDNIDPTGLKSLFDQPDDLLTGLTQLRDQEIDAIYADLRTNGTRIQKQFLDRYALGREQVRKLGEDLAQLLTRLPVDPADKDSPVDQIIAAVALIKLKVAPVVTIHLPFGGDNHNDSDLSVEAQDTLASVGSLNTLWTELTAQGLQDQVTFASLNVFGRTLKRNASGGRNHNQNHHVMALFGKHVKGGVIGGVDVLAQDFAATGIDSKTGQADPSGDVTPLSSLESAGKTLAAALQVPNERIEARINAGKIVSAALVA